MITYLTISCITLCFCVITYLWVRHHWFVWRGLGERVTRINYQTVRRSASLYPSTQLTHNVFPDEVRPKTDKLSPKKRMKVHKIDQGIRKETFVSPRLSYGKWRDRQ